MGIEMIGIDHSLAEIDIRMIFSFTKKCTTEAYVSLKGILGIEGCVLLSTCNRMELWISTNRDWSGDLYEILCEIREVNPEIYREYFVCRREKEAVQHLFRLAGGLESRILGEDQIVTQVREALAFSRENYAADHVLETLFRQAVTAAKKVKTTVPLSSTDQSVVHSMIRSLIQEGMEFSGKKCMVIGNGIMGKLAATLLTEQGADVTVTVRQYRSGMVVIPENCSRIDYGRRMELFGQCDYVVSATVSPNYTLTKELVGQALECPVVLIDLAVPRDIDPFVKELPGVKLYDVDSFREEAHSEEQRQAIAEAETLLEEQMEEFFVWYECVDLMPMIRKLKVDIAEDLQPRLQKKLRVLPVSDDEREQLKDDIEAAAVRTMNKMIFGLRDGLDRNTFRKCLDCLNELYGK